MNIQTKYFGEIEVEESKRIQFPAGLPGFLEETEFMLLDLPGNSVFQLLQSLKTPTTAFVVTNPHHFYKEYTVNLDDSIIEALRITNEQDVAILVIVTLASPLEQSTLNLKAPVVINVTSRYGKQYILNTTDYSSKAVITPNAANGKGE
ncbi:flagellar assembly protein FliW [Lentibacillus sp. N15]|uniref:flagellar assembly protein FliW n=1 Tax=Lentibacillus songyuanensis TaxID=3136161 RepID=UPI0031BBAB63